jgi:hypothetical protein
MFSKVGKLDIGKLGNCGKLLQLNVNGSACLPVYKNE